MPTIRKLPVGLVNKIAAGEVIERPASVVKELLENSIDAGAGSVEVSIEGGGIDLIRITDNGCGIDPEQLPLAIAPHATSKLPNDDDLFDVRTLGFRGEALASIAEISHMTIRSRTADSDSAFVLGVKGGEPEPVQPTSGPIGTTIEIRHLFFNTPVRRKFMKSAQTEMGHVVEAFTRVALAYPHVHLALNNGSKTLYDLPPTERWSERIRKFFGDEVADALISIDQKDERVSIRGYVADPSVSRSNNRMQYLFLNGRYIRDRALQHSLGEAYRGLLMVGRMPVCFLHIDIDPKTVDVNVHPTKVEVRFEDSGAIYSRLLAGLRNKFLNSDLVARVRIPSSSPDPSAPAGIPVPMSAGRGIPNPNELLDWAKTTTAALPNRVPDFRPFSSEGRAVGSVAALQSAHSSRPVASDDPFFAPSLPIVAPGAVAPVGIATGNWDAIPSASPTPPNAVVWSPDQPVALMDDDTTVVAMRADEAHSIDGSKPHVGFQIQNRYIITEDDEGMAIIDQHALHERILYEQIKNKVLAKTLDVQRLLVPETITLSAAETALALEYQDVLREIGIEIEPFGGDTLLISSYPAMLRGISPGEVLRQVLDPLMSGGKKPDVRNLLDEIMNMVACKAAVKAGDRLSSDEISSLLSQRHLYHDTHHCPHGRPTALFFSREQLDKMFKRT
ncbi:MAG: DNA mismatch repair endonuclease MutL [Pirellula sp.]|nr:DNA mismatch repair endonuclease MutL [Pirellula sp.]